MIYCNSLNMPEGPVALKDGSWLVVEMGPDRGCITHITEAGKKKRVVAKTGRPNGLAIDNDQNIWCAESQNPALLKISLDGEVEEILTGCGDEPFLFPNDLAFGPDGKLYLTDSGVLIDDFAPGGNIRPDYDTVPLDGRVYRIDVNSRAIEKLDTGIRFTNGIAFGPDDDLYVNETLTGDIFRYRYDSGEIGANGKIGPRTIFGNVIAPDAPEGIKGPDGMKFGQDGNLYVTVFAQGDVTVLGRDGSVVDRIKTAGVFPTNLAFGLPGDQRIYVTEDEKGTLEVFDIECEGLPLYYGS